MIEGTRTYKGKNPPTAMSPEVEAPSPAASPTTMSPAENDALVRADAANPERRKLFTQLLPMAGQGLVKILRESNLLKDELRRAIKKR